MTDILLVFKRKILPLTVVTLFVLASGAITALAIRQLTRAFSPPKDPIAKIVAEDGEQNGAKPESEQTDISKESRGTFTIGGNSASILGSSVEREVLPSDNAPAPAAVNDQNESVNQTATQPPSARPTAVNTNATNRCIITLSGQQYDVTPLITSHPGGNIFKCGTDQTAVYVSQHGNDFGRMRPYLITGNTGANVSGSQTSAPSVSGNSFDDDKSDDDWEDD